MECCVIIRHYVYCYRLICIFLIFILFLFFILCCFWFLCFCFLTSGLLSCSNFESDCKISENVFSLTIGIEDVPRLASSTRPKVELIDDEVHVSFSKDFMETCTDHWLAYNMRLNLRWFITFGKFAQILWIQDLELSKCF